MLVGDRDPRAHEFSVQLRAMDNDRTGADVGLPALMAVCSGLLEKNIKGGLILVGALNLGGSVEPLANAVGIVEAAVEKGGVSCLDAGIGAEAVVRAFGRHGDADQRPVLFGYAGCIVEGVA